MRIAITSIICLMLGVCGGVFGLKIAMGKNLDSALERCASLDKQAQESKRLADDTLERARFLEEQNAALTGQVQSLQSRMESAPNPDATGLESDMAAFQTQQAALDPGAPPPPGPGGLEPGAQDPNDPRTDEQKNAEREAQRQEWGKRMSERFDEVTQNLIDGTEDPATQERLAQMHQYTQDMMAVGAQMRDAKTDEERQQLREQMGQTMQTMGQLRQQQQDSMARDLASQYNVPASKQDAFVASLQELQNSPYYSPERAYMGGGPGGFGGPGGMRGGFGGMGGGRGNRGGDGAVAGAGR